MSGACRRYSRRETMIAYWGMGLYWGRACSNNNKGHMIGHIKVRGSTVPHSICAAGMLPMQNQGEGVMAEAFVACSGTDVACGTHCHMLCRMFSCCCSASQATACKADAGQAPSCARADFRYAPWHCIRRTSGMTQPTPSRACTPPALRSHTTTTQPTS